MADKIFFHDLRLECVVGVYDAERTGKRPLRLDIELEADLSPGTLTDRIEDTLSYEEVYRAVRALVEQSECRLLEALAESVAACCLRFERVRGARVRIDKTGILDRSGGTGVEIERFSPPDQDTR